MVGQEATVAERIKIIELHFVNGMSYRMSALIMKKPKSTIQNLIKRWKHEGRVANKNRSGNTEGK